MEPGTELHTQLPPRPPWRERIVGLDQRLPLLDGRLAPYINLDNAASTPPLRDVLEAVQRFLPYYSSVHRGTGFKSRVSTAAYDEAHDTSRALSAPTRARNTVIFGKNTTEAINKLAFRYPLAPRQRRALDRDGASLERSAVAARARSSGRASHPTGGSTKTTWTGCSPPTASASRS